MIYYRAMKAKLSVVLRIVISLGMVGFLLWSMRGNFPHIKRTLSQANPVIFLTAILTFMSISTTLMAARLRMLLKGENLNISFGKVLQLTYVGFFFNNFMPTAVGGDIVKAYYIHKHTHKTKSAFMAVFMDRFIGLFSFVLIALLALLISWNTIIPSLRKIIILMGLAAGCGLIVVVNTSVANFILKALSRFKFLNLGKRISKVYMAVHEYHNKKRVILGVILISILAQCLYFIIVYLLAMSLSANITLLSVFLIMPVVSLVSMLPSLGGLGLREGAILVLFGPLTGNDTAFSISILLLALLLSVSVVGAVIYIFASQFKIKRKDVAELKAHRV